MTQARCIDFAEFGKANSKSLRTSQQPSIAQVSKPMVAGAMTRGTAAKIIRNVAGVAHGSPSNKLGISINDH